MLLADCVCVCYDLHGSHRQLLIVCLYHHLGHKGNPWPSGIRDLGNSLLYFSSVCILRSPDPTDTAESLHPCYFKNTSYLLVKIALRFPSREFPKFTWILGCRQGVLP